MPYEIQESQGKYCVHKEGEEKPILGGCHDSRDKATRHMRALYAAEGVATKEHTGAMIALPVHDGYHAWLGTLQAQLPPGSNLTPSEDLHLTLLYLGNTDHIEEFKTLIYGGALDAIKWQEENLGATVTGVARFNGKDGRSPVVLLMDSPLFPEFRQRVYANIAHRGVPSEQEHGFIPHITLGYIPADADTPQIRVPRARLLFEELLIAWGDEQLRLPLSQPNKTKAVRYNSIDFSPPESVQATARAGLEKRREFGRGGTSIGLARARDLSAGKRMSPSTIKRMVSYFARHEVDKNGRGFNSGEEGYPSNGRIAWELWGGDAGKAWAEKVARQMSAADTTTKAEGRGYGARAGEVIRGNLTRGGDGKFASAGSAPAADEKKPTIRRQRLGRSAAARDERKRQEAEAKRQARTAESARRKREATARREAKKRAAEEAKKRELAENRKRILDQTGVPDEAMKGLEDFAAGQEIEFDSELADELTARGFLLNAGGDTYKMSAAGRAFLAAAKSGDLRKAKDALASGRGIVRKRQEARQREIERMERDNEKSLSVFKDASGRYRWILLSSNAYRDRDGEIVSLKALAQDVMRADTDKDYGPLRWWHVPGADIGDCDYNALFGRFLVESGTFRNETIGEGVFKAQGKLKASIGFRHPSNEPDVSGVYHNIRRFERSLVPAGRAANPFTSLLVRGGKMTDEERLAKLKELEALTGPGALDSVLEAVKSAQAEADNGGVAYKEEKPPLTVGEVVKAIKGEGVGTGNAGISSLVTSVGGTITWGDTTGPAPHVTTKEEGEGGMEGGEYAGDMAPDALASMIASAVANAIAPLMQALDVSTKMGEMVGAMEELKGMMGGTARKDDEIAALQELQARKSAEEAEARAELQKQAEALATQLKEVQTKLDELAGEQPRSHKSGRANGYRASQADDNIVEEQHRLKSAAPTGVDPNFLPFLFGQDNQGPPPA